MILSTLSVGNVLWFENGERALLVDNNGYDCPSRYSLISLVTAKIIFMDDYMLKNTIEKALDSKIKMIEEN